MIFTILISNKLYAYYFLDLENQRLQYRMCFYFLILIQLLPILYSNYILNGNFQSPSTYSPNVLYFTTPTSWNGNSIDIHNDNLNLGFGQYLDLQAGYNQNGYVSQIFSFLSPGNYNLSFYQKAATNIYNDHKMSVYWNGVLITTKVPNTTAVTFQTIILYGIAGNNTLLLQEVGDSAYEYYGLFIDQISLNYIPSPAPTPSNSSTNTSSPLNITTNTSNGISNTTNSTNNGTYNTNATNFTNTTNATNPANTTNYNETNVLPSATNIIQKTDRSKQETIWIISIILSLPLNQIVSMRCVYFMADDLWLYNYDVRYYKGILEDVFSTITIVQNTKFQVLQKYLGMGKYKEYLKFSNYSQFTLEKFIEIESSSFVLLDSNFAFFIYYLPQTIITCLLLYGLSQVTYNWKIGQYLRKYSFLKSTLIQTLIEGNTSYFTYICLSNLEILYNFEFYHKYTNMIMVVFFFLLILSSFVFYPLLNHYLQKNSAHYIFCFYRFNPSLAFLSYYNLIRNMVKGSLYFFLKFNYLYQIVGLCLLEGITIIVTVILESSYGIFLTKLCYCLTLIYRFLFVLLNVNLYLQFTQSQSKMVEDIFLLIQQAIVYSMVVVVILMAILDVIPLKWLERPDFLQSIYKNYLKLSVEMKQKKKKKDDKQKAIQRLKACFNTKTTYSKQREKFGIYYRQDKVVRGQVRLAKKIKTEKKIHDEFMLWRDTRSIKDQ